ncbi:alkyl hydroperoxide reductase, partial [Streptomyces minutiscleroticus]|uniref:alkyl hydroperoxide reductase n=1 Tax=Streptomyces minutiscleroticus TaxID=68238 RepID=UPI0033177DDC
MSLDSLKSRVPDYAKDLKLNLGSVIGNSDLPAQQLWGTVLATAIASRSPIVLRELEPEAKANLSPEAYTAAKSAAAVMAMNNVFYRTRHLLSDHEYGNTVVMILANAWQATGVAVILFLVGLQSIPP